MCSRQARGQCPYESLLENKHLNLIPTGRQLQRTPPTKTLNTRTSCPAEDPAIREEQTSQNVVKDDAPPYWQEDTTCPSIKKLSYRRSSLTPATATSGNADPNVLIHGMQGYQWTDRDLEFVYQTKYKKLQQELHEVEKTLQAEGQRLEFAIASREQLRLELSKIQSYNSILLLCKSLLSQTQSSEQLDSLEDRDLLLLLNLQDVQKAICQENAEIRRLEAEVNKAQERRDKEETEKDNWQKKITFQASMVSQEPEKGHKGSRKAKLSTVAPREKVWKESIKNEMASKAGKDMAEKGMTGGKGKMKASKKITSQGTAEKELAPDETAFQVKTTPEELHPKVKATKVAQVPKVGRKDSRRAKKETVLEKEKEMVPKEKAGKDTVDERRTAPIRTTSRNTSRKEIPPTEMPLQVKSPVDKLLEKARKGSIAAKTSSRNQKDKVQEKVDMKDFINTLMLTCETKSKLSPKLKAVKKMTSKAAEKELAPDERVNTPKETILQKIGPEETAPKVAPVLEEGHKGLRRAKPSIMALKEEVLKDIGEKEMAPNEKACSDTADEPKITSKEMVPKKIALKKTAKKEAPPKEMPLQVKTSMEELLETGRKGTRAPKGKARRKAGLINLTEMDTIKKIDGEINQTSQTAPKIKAPKKTSSDKKKLDPDEKFSKVNTLQAVPLEEMVTIISQESEKCQKRSRRAKPSTKGLQETAEKEPSLKEKTVKDRVEKAKTALMEKGTKRITSNKVTEKELTQNDTGFQVKIPEEMALDEPQMSQNGHKKSRRANASSNARKEEVSKKKGDKNTSKEGKNARKEKAPKNMITKEAGKKEITPDEPLTQVKTPVETDLEDLFQKVKSSNVQQMPEKDCNKSKRTKNMTTAPKNKAQMKTAVKQSTENDMDVIEMEDKEIAETGETVSEIQASKKTTSKKTVKKEWAQDEVVSKAMTLEKAAPKRPCLVKSSKNDQVLEKCHKGSRGAIALSRTKRGNAKRTENELITLETSDEEMARKCTTLSKKIKPKRKTSKEDHREQISSK